MNPSACWMTPSTFTAQLAWEGINDNATGTVRRDLSRTQRSPVSMLGATPMRAARSATFHRTPRPTVPVCAARWQTSGSETDR